MDLKLVGLVLLVLMAGCSLPQEGEEREIVDTTQKQPIVFWTYNEIMRELIILSGDTNCSSIMTYNETIACGINQGFKELFVLNRTLIRKGGDCPEKLKCCSDYVMSVECIDGCYFNPIKEEECMSTKG